LHYMKVQMVERIKLALNYNLQYESPLVHVERFFANTFSEGQMDMNPLLTRWR